MYRLIELPGGRLRRTPLAVDARWLIGCRFWARGRARVTPHIFGGCVANFIAAEGRMQMLLFYATPIQRRIIIISAQWPACEEKCGEAERAERSTTCQVLRRRMHVHECRRTFHNLQRMKRCNFAFNRDAFNFIRRNCSNFATDLQFCTMEKHWIVIKSAVFAVEFFKIYK